MFAEKIKLTDAYLDLIIQKRKEHSFTAYQLSEHIGKNKSWLPNIENRRTKNITKEEFLSIFQDFAKEENMDTETYIIKYLPSDALIELEDSTCVPCCYLKTKQNLPPQETAFTELASPSNELFQLNQSLSDFNQTIQQIFSTLSFFRNTLPLCDNDTKEKENHYSNTSLLEDISNFIENFSVALSFINANIYRFFDPEFSNETLSYKIEHYQYGNLQELTEILFDIETYSYAIYDYTNLFYKDTKIKKEEYTLNYQELYHILFQLIKDFLYIAELSYSFEFELPNIHPTKEELEKKHLETTNILFQIRNLFYTKYNSNAKNTKKTTFLTEPSELYFDHSYQFNKAKKQKEKIQKDKMQKWQKFQKEKKCKTKNITP